MFSIGKSISEFSPFVTTVCFVPLTNNITLPKGKKPETQILTAAQQETFVNAIKGHRLETAFYLSLTTGMREGEIVALTWDDINFNDCIVKVNKNALRVNVYDETTKEKTGTKVVIQDRPKSQAGTRSIPLLPITIDKLRQHKVRQNDEMVTNRALYVNNKLVFCNEVGQLYDPKTFYHALRKVCELTEGLEKIKFHALRHTFATRALESGLAQRTVQDILGHETPDMTLHYTHVLEEHKKVEMQKLEGVFHTPMRTPMR